MRAPANKIIKGYTSGKEYTYKKSTNFYIGHFFKLNNRYYVGKDYDPDVKQLEIVPINKTKAINDPNSLLYNFLAGAKSGLNTPPKFRTRPTKSDALASIDAANKEGFTPVIGVNLDSDSNAIQTNADEIQQASTPVEVKRYFVRRLKRPFPPVYKFSEINEQEYNEINAKNYPPIRIKTAFFTETRIQGEKPSPNPGELKEAEKRIPGLKKFLGIENDEE